MFFRAVPEGRDGIFYLFRRILQKVSSHSLSMRGLFVLYYDKCGKFSPSNKYRE